jgi:tetratricopeptide (TPR) repeat protein
VAGFRHALTFVVLLSGAASVRGQAAPSSGAVAEARQRFAAGEQAFKERRWEDALEQFSVGFKLDPRPDFLYQLARTHEKLGQLDEAIANCESFLAVAPSSPRAPDVWKLIGDLKGRK